jgi:hypothetical protein
MTETREVRHQVNNREAWLKAFSKSVAGSMASSVELEADASLRLSCGFAPSMGRRKVASAVLLAPSCSADDSAELFVSPELAEADKVADAILPLIIQAHLGDWANRMTAQFMRELSVTRIKAQALQVCGAYPHAEITLPVRRTDGTRLLKVVCSVEPANFVVRMSAKCLNVGTPVCPCHNQGMVQA